MSKKLLLGASIFSLLNFGLPPAAISANLPQLIAAEAEKLKNSPARIEGTIIAQSDDAGYHPDSNDPTHKFTPKEHRLPPDVHKKDPPTADELLKESESAKNAAEDKEKSGKKDAEKPAADEGKKSKKKEKKIKAEKSESAEPKKKEKKAKDEAKKEKKSDAEPKVAKQKKSKMGDSSDTAAAADGSAPPRITINVDPKTYKSINQGDWKSAADRLEKLTAGSTQPTRDNAVLAFAYMFMGNDKSLEALQKRVNEGTVPDELSGYKMVIDAMVQVSKGKTEDADKTLDNLPKRHVNDAFINFVRAAVAGKQGKAGAAAELCRRSIELDPTFAWGYRTLGYLQDRWLNQQMDAEESFQQALLLEPDQAEVRDMLITNHLMRNDFDNAIDIANAGIKAQKDGRSYYRLALVYIQQWRLRDALGQLEKAIAAEPGNPSFYRTRATIRRFQGYLPDAIADQKKAVELAKDKPFELIELSNMYAQNGESNTAVETLHEAQKLDPTNKMVHKALITLLSKERRFDELVDEYKRGIKNSPQDAGLHYSLAETLHTLGNDDEAIEEYKLAANMDQKDPRPHRRLAAIYAAQKDYDKSINASRRSLTINASSVYDLYQLGVSYAQTGQFLQAEAGFVTALALQQLAGNTSPEDPRREDIIRSLASLLVAEGRYADAAAQFESLYGMTRETDKAAGDRFLLQQAKLLSDRKEASANDLIANFDGLAPERQNSFRYMLVQTLLRVGKPDLATKQMSALSEDQLANDPRWLPLNARVARLKGDLPGAKSAIEDAIKSAGEKYKDDQTLMAELLMEKARILNADGQTEQAELCANQALEKLDKTSATSYVVLGQIKLKQEPQLAIDLAKKALEQNPYLTDAYILAGDAYMKKNSAKEALENYKKATEIYPGFVDAHKALLKSYKALAMNDEVKKEEAQITNMEKVQ